MRLADARLGVRTADEVQADEPAVARREALLREHPHPALNLRHVHVVVVELGGGRLADGHHPQLPVLDQQRGGVLLRGHGLHVHERLHLPRLLGRNRVAISGHLPQVGAQLIHVSARQLEQIKPMDRVVREVLQDVLLAFRVVRRHQLLVQGQDLGVGAHAEALQDAGQTVRLAELRECVLVVEDRAQLLGEAEGWRGHALAFLPPHLGEFLAELRVVDGAHGRADGHEDVHVVLHGQRHEVALVRLGVGARVRNGLEDVHDVREAGAGQPILLDLDEDDLDALRVRALQAPGEMEGLAHLRARDQHRDHLLLAARLCLLLRSSLARACLLAVREGCVEAGGWDEQQQKNDVHEATDAVHEDHVQRSRNQNTTR
mmetsp:Transcript_84039/g.234069  ORF Transcript_84039/g.234069 Transcript_84039/m.234069 type:complete len:374 (-) Transcript_84039:131-1252(-)